MSKIEIPTAPPIIKKPPKEKKPKKEKLYDSEGRLLRKDGVTIDKRPETAKEVLLNTRVKEALDKVKQKEIMDKAEELRKQELELSDSSESEPEADEYDIIEYVMKPKKQQVVIPDPIVIEKEVIKEVPKEIIKEVIKEVPQPINQELLNQNTLLRNSLVLNNGIEDVKVLRAKTYKRR